MQPVRFDPGAELARAIWVNFVKFLNFSGHVSVEEMVSREWASVTFTGARHAFSLRLQGAGAGTAADAFLFGLAERDFALRGHILADIELVAEERRDGGEDVRIALEALTVEES